jgi:hypothetical protein
VVLAGVLLLAAVFFKAAFVLGAAAFLRANGRAFAVRGFLASGVSIPVVAANLPSVLPTIRAAALRKLWFRIVCLCVIFKPFLYR